MKGAADSNGLQTKIHRPGRRPHPTSPVARPPGTRASARQLFNCFDQETTTGRNTTHPTPIPGTATLSHPYNRALGMRARTSVRNEHDMLVPRHQLALARGAANDQALHAVLCMGRQAVELVDVQRLPRHAAGQATRRGGLCRLCWPILAPGPAAPPLHRTPPGRTCHWAGKAS